MAFIDWLRKQHEESERNRRLFENRPGTLRAGEVPTHQMVAANRAWGGGPGSGSGYQDRQDGQRLMVRQPIRRPKIDNTLTVKDDGTRTHVKKWTDVASGQEPRDILRATALPPEPVMSPGRELRGYPTFDRDSFRTRGMGGFTGGAQRYDMGMDPGWSGVPRARAAPQPRRVQPRSSISPEAQAAIAQVQATGGQNVDASGSPISVPSIANIGMPRVADLRNRVREIERQQAAIPRQQMPPPRFVSPVDWRNFPQVQDRNTGTYNLGDPGVQMSGGFDWTGRALRENVGEDLRNVWNPISDRVKQMLEQIRKRREGQTMAPFDWGNY